MCVQPNGYNLLVASHTYGPFSEYAPKISFCLQVGNELIEYINSYTAILQALSTINYLLLSIYFEKII